MIYRLLNVWFIAVIFSISAPAGAQTTVVKGAVDNREYSFLTLDNGLRVLLVSDPTTDKAAAALDVSVGSADNPADREGLAHFLEHMLFLGTEKYPEPGDYQRFISEHGGSHNAYTSSEHTNYFFDVSHEYLYQTLDQFAQFFITPSLDDTYIKRETNAVHSEYQAKIKDDFRRGYDVYRQLLNPAHPYSKFSVGSADTLVNSAEQPIKEDLVAFYKEHYVAGNMTLVVLGRDSIAELHKNVSAMFSAVPKSNLGVNEDGTSEVLATKPQNRPSLFLPDALPKTVYVKPVRDSRSLALVFPLPPSNNYLEKPLSYLSHILGYEGRGSLLSVLKAKGWAEGLSAGGDNQAYDHSTFTISVSLTEEGYKHLGDIQTLVFDAIATIRKQGINQWRFDEIKQLSKLNFQFREKTNPISAVSELANNLQYYSPEDVIRGDYAYDNFNAKTIKQFAEKLTPQNSLTIVTAPEVTTDTISDKYQVPYRIAAALESVELDKDLQKSYQLPLANPFVPADISLLSKPEKLYTAPQLIKEVPKQTLWYLQDTQFNVPKAFVASRIKSPLISRSAKQAAIAQLWAALINDRLNETLYDASLAGLSANVLPTNRGVDIEVSGYNDKLPLLLKTINNGLRNNQFSSARFEDLKKELIRTWRNNSKQTPYKRLFAALPATLYSPYWADQVLIDNLQSVSLAELKLFTKGWHKGAEQEVLVYGNIDSTQAQKIFSMMSSSIMLGDNTINKAKVAKLELAEALSQTVQVNHTDNATMLYVQADGDTLEDIANMALINQILNAPFYNDLRTEQQLGYIVFVTSYAFKDVASAAFMVQSPTKDVAHLKGAISTFVADFALPKDIDSHRNAVIAKLTEKPKRLSEQASRYWHSLLRDDNNFEYRQQLAKAVSELTAPGVQKYFDTVFKTPTRKLWLLSKKKGDSDAAKPAENPLSPSSHYEYP